MNPADSHDSATFAQLLSAAVEEPGVISSAYSTFWNYSVGNQLLAWAQATERQIPLGPIATYAKWRQLGRQVRRGEKAIVLCQPITIRKTGEPDTDGRDPAVFTTFKYKAGWFLICQTDGPEIAPATVPGWEKALALQALNISEIPFQHHDGNCQGYASGRSIAVSPIAAFPLKTLFHELAHVLLHTGEGEHRDDDRTLRNLRECEAESIAMICCAALGLPGIDAARGYIQSWWGKGNPIPESSARAILKAADSILRAGRPTEGL